MRRPLSAVMFVGLLVAVDQFIKSLVESRMNYREMIDLLPFFALFRTHNEGIAFSMLDGFGALPLVAISILVIGFVLWLWRASPADRVLSHAGYALIIGGAVGNLIDRARLGYVVDYFLFHTPQWSFAVFNLADTAISIGAAVVVLDEFIAWRRQSAVEKSD